MRYLDAEMEVIVKLTRIWRTKKANKDAATLQDKAAPVVRTLTLPGGKKLRVMRQDAFDRAISRAAAKHVA